ncbi:hypothetical protein ACLOJK_006648 [Asimina triloba]
MKNLGGFFVESGTSAAMVDGDTSGSESYGGSSIFQVLRFGRMANFLVHREVGSVVGESVSVPPEVVVMLRGWLRSHDPHELEMLVVGLERYWCVEMEYVEKRR